MPSMSGDKKNEQQRDMLPTSSAAKLRVDCAGTRIDVHVQCSVG